MTLAQQRASEPSRSAWVTASAGTGKTKVLTDRVLRLMLAGTEPERILCITFTKAAAAEMALRVNETLSRWATAEQATLAGELAALMGEAPDEAALATARRLLAALLDAPGGIRIQTIHAFCQSILRRFPLEAGIAPHFEVADERDSLEMLAAARDAVLHRARWGGDEELTGALEEVTRHLAEQDFQRVMAELAGSRRRLSALFRHKGHERDPIAVAHKLLGVEPGESEAGLIARACVQDAFDRPALEAARAALEAGSATDRQRAEGLAAWLAASTADRAARFDSYRGLFLTRKGEPRQTLINKKAAAGEPGAADALASEQARIVEIEERRRALGVAVSSAAMLKLGAALIDAYEEEKAKRSRLDYDDQILMVLELLRNHGAAWVLYKLDRGLDHILLDEAQDTAPEQWQVIAALAGEFFAGIGARDAERTLFVVGDEKQAIFSFQGADPREAERMRGAFALQVRSAGKGWEEIPLERSFRSTEAVLKAVDAVFAREQASNGVALSGAAIRHEAERKGQAGLVEVWPPAVPRELEPPAPWRPPLEHVPSDSPAARLARRIAHQIAGWLAQGEVLESQARPVRPGDIMVLVRRRTAFVEELVRALKSHDVPVAGVDRLVLTEQIAVMDLIALGHFLLFPDDDLTLATVLKSPLVGFDEDLLFDLAFERGARSLWDRLKERRDEMPAFAAAHLTLAELLSRVDFVPPFELFAEVLGGLGGRKALIRRLGLEADDPLDEFLSLALAYQRTHAPSLQGFLRWLEEGRAEIKRDLDRGRNEVRVMTVHGAKGLEAPIVFLPETMQTPQDGSGHGHQLLWAGNGEAGEALLWPGRASRDDVVSAEARRAHKAREAEEYRRLLYVAMTRAQDRLYISAWRGRNEPKPDCWYHLIWEGLAEFADRVAFDFTGQALDGWKGPGLRLEGAQTAIPEGKEKPEAGAASLEGLPDFARKPPAPESAGPRPLSPSRSQLSPPPVGSPLGPGREGGFQRGRLIHRLLEILPEIEPERRAEAARRYLARPGHGLEPGAAEEIARATLSVLEEASFRDLFGPESRAEVPLAALIGERMVLGQVDRLLVGRDEVVVVDYKTNREPPSSADAIPPAYLAQMAAYRAVLERIFPDKKIRCALLWTDGPQLMPLADEALAAYAP